VLKAKKTPLLNLENLQLQPEKINAPQELSPSDSHHHSSSQPFQTNITPSHLMLGHGNNNNNLGSKHTPMGMLFGGGGTSTKGQLLSTDGKFYNPIAMSPSGAVLSNKPNFTALPVSKGSNILNPQA
jgi:hypothetical protein